MLGQVTQALRNGNASTIARWAGQFKVAQPSGRGWYYAGLPDEMSEREIRLFASTVGLPAWERKYGETVDANFANFKKEKDARAVPQPGA